VQVLRLTYSTPVIIDLISWIVGNIDRQRVTGNVFIAALFSFRLMRLLMALTDGLVLLDILHALAFPLG